MIDYIKQSTPLGDMILASDGSALCGAWFAGQKYFPVTEGWREGEDRALEKAAVELRRYFSGELRCFTVPLRPRGTTFQQKVWAGISEIAYGQTASYGELAARLGSAPRAVGAATGRNPVSVFIPCHRLVGHGALMNGAAPSDKSLTGYAGGLDKKRALLTLEGVILSPANEHLF
ncbi:MAG: methylated-DNA--[protein]-cysteine S-methyltransferase [Synergistaceae bacterium]|jgi:methylated-DNA-[protein]-cysteine S-methyltransferase|nr:methylated-DNA--[protein]-cysteine S-methyltransferase [Synergistaceae bacterium]